MRISDWSSDVCSSDLQRLKLAGHLAAAARSGISSAKVAKKGSLFLFDEPTTGLHFDDVARLMRAFRKLLAAGHSLLIIEHNLDRSEEHTSELQSLMRSSYAVFCLKKKTTKQNTTTH